MALDSYSGLKAAIAAHIVVGGVDEERIDDFIDLVEARNRQELELPNGRSVPPVMLRDMQARLPLTIASTGEDDDRFVALPERFLAASLLRLLAEPSRGLGERVLEQLAPDQLARRRRPTLGEPRSFTVHTAIELERAPDRDYAAEIVCWQAVLPLDSDNPSNAILATAPNLYLYGALAASAPLLLHDERIPVWENAYIAARVGVAGAARRARLVGPQRATLRTAVP